MRNPLQQLLVVVLLADLTASCSDRSTEPDTEASARDPSYVTTNTSADPVGPRPHAILRREFDQPIPNDEATTLAWDAEDADFGDLHVTGSNEVTLGPGTWLLIAVVSFQNDIDGFRSVSIGSSPIGRAWTMSSIAGETVTQTLVASVPGGTTATYWVNVHHTAGNSISVLGQRYSYFMVVQLGSEPYVRLRKSAHQATFSHVATSVNWDVESADAWNLHSAGSATVTLGSGIWLLSPLVAWESNAAGYREALILENGTEIGRVFSEHQSGSTWQSTDLPLVRVVPSGATRNYVVSGFQNSGADDLSVLGETCWLGFCARYSHFNVAQLSSAPHVVLRKSIDQAIPWKTFTNVAWDVEDADSVDLHAPGAHSVTLGSGVWLLIAVVNWQPLNGGYHGVRIMEASEIGRSFSPPSFGRSSKTVTLPLVRVVPAGVTRQLSVEAFWDHSAGAPGGTWSVQGGVSSYFIAVQLATL